MEKIRLNAGIIQADISLGDADRDAAWEMYVEMLTRIVTRPLPDDAGDEKAALESVHTLFPVTREMLRQHGLQTIQFSKVAIPVLNQAVRPFTAKRQARMRMRHLAAGEAVPNFARSRMPLQKACAIAAGCRILPAPAAPRRPARPEGCGPRPAGRAMRPL